jgi:AbiU2
VNSSASVDLEQWFKLLWVDLLYAGTYYQLWKELVEASPDYEREFGNASAFWGLSSRAYLDSTVLRLCRIYDKTNDARSLPKLLKFIRRNRLEFSRDRVIERVKRKYRDEEPREFAFPTLDETQLAKDDQLVRETDDDVGILHGWRKKGYVHLDLDLLSPDWTLLKPQPLLPQIPTLLDRAFEILNRYNGLYDGTHHLDNTFQNWDDYRLLLQALRLGLLANALPTR